MSLLDDFKESCVLLDRTTSRDEYGSFVTEWRDGAPFEAIFRFDNSTAERVAAAQGVKNLYSILVARDAPLRKFDVLRRLSNDQVYRVTSDGKDNKTPVSASLNLKMFSAEEWTLTGNYTPDEGADGDG